MKKLLLSALIAVSLISSAFAAPEKKVSYFIKSAFEVAFPNAENVEWKLTDEYAKATFEADNMRTEAYYTLTGKFVGSSHAVSLEKLPVNVKRDFAKKYGSYTVTEAILFEGSEETAYYISAKNDKQSVVLKVLDGGISVFKVTAN